MHIQRHPSTRFAVRALCALLSLAHVAVMAAPAQIPLLTASAGPKPNVVLTLDDSGSMNWQMMPESVGVMELYDSVSVRTGTQYTKKTSFSCRNAPTVPTTIPPSGTYRNCYNAQDTYRTDYVPSGGSRQLHPTFHPSDNFMRANTTLNENGGTRTYPARNDSGVVDTNPVGLNGAPNIYGMRMRSVSINGLYYDPNTVYKPWPAPMLANLLPSGLIEADGTIKDLTKVPVDPSRIFSTATVDLKNSTTTSARWCASGILESDMPNNTDICPTSTRTFDPAVYYKLIQGTGTSASDFERVDINQTADATLRESQLKNFATWFTYYRTRIFMAKGAAGLAFANQKDDQFRLGYGRINLWLRGYDSRGQAVSQSVTTDGYQNKTLLKGVRQFNDKTTEQVKSSFFTWLMNLRADGGTPLRQAMTDIGNYFSATGKSTNGDPYRSDPTNAGQEALACRRNFHIMVTDGYWNDSVTSANHDGTAGNAITGTDSREYTYQPISPYTDTTSNTLADIAMYYWKNDLRTDLENSLQVPEENLKAPARDQPSVNPAFWQHMVNFTVGLGVDGTIPSSSTLGSFTWPAPAANAPTTIDDLWHAAVNSRGTYLKATNPVAFAKSLSSILTSITSTGGTVSGVAVSRAALVDGVQKFVPSFEPERWSGELTGLELNATGAVKGTGKWQASLALPAFDKRNILAGTASGSAVAFTAGSLPIDPSPPLGHVTGIGASGTLEVLAPTVDADLINYLRGDTSKEGDSLKFRPRKTIKDTTGTTRINVLGDFVNSVPVFIKGASFDNDFLPSAVNGKSTGSATYSKYLGEKRKRAGLVLAGANDGMLHGFRATDGVEMFGFIPFPVLRGDTHPNTVQPDSAKSGFTGYFGLARLSDKNYNHQFYVDGQITEADISSCSSLCTWQNIAVASTGGGAKNVFALDVTSNFSSDDVAQPTIFKAQNVLWSLDPSSLGASVGPDLGYVMAPVEVGMAANGEWVAVFGNGYDSANGKAVLFIVSAKTGAVIKTIQASSDGGNGLGGVRLVRDINNVIVQAYAGDLKGNVWKFDLTGKSSGDWKLDFGGAPLFTAKLNSTPQAITAAPNYALHPKGGLMVIVSTGKLYAETDTSGAASTQQSIYGLWDKAPIGKTSATSAEAIASSSLLSTRVVQVTNEANRSSDATFNIINESEVADNRGWQLKMLIPDGERGIYTPQFISGYTYVETVLPGKVAGESCSLGEGAGYGYLLNTFTGFQPAKVVLDVNGDSKFDGQDNKGVFKRDEPPRGSVLGGDTGKGSVIGSKGGRDTAPIEELPERTWRQIYAIPE